MSGRRPWWRTNRWWLGAIPFALVAMLASSAYNVKPGWYDLGLHHRVAVADLGAPLTVTEGFTDALGSSSRTYTVTLVSVTPTSLYPYQDEGGADGPPDGLQALRVTLDWAADPDQVLRGCTISLYDEQGRQYDVDDRDNYSICTPFLHQGPRQAAPGETTRDVPDEERPPTWTTTPVVLVPDGRTITQVRVWWSTPDYVELRAS